MAENQYRTNSRTKILDYLVSNQDRTISAKDVEQYMLQQGWPVNITTIYRYLDKLEKGGKVIKYPSQKGKIAVYQYVNPEQCCEQHLHLKCTVCGSISHLDCEFMNEISSHIASEHGFMLQCKDSMLFGLCSKCGRIEDKRRR